MSTKNLYKEWGDISNTVGNPLSAGDTGWGWYFG